MCDETLGVPPPFKLGPGSAGGERPLICGGRLRVVFLKSVTASEGENWELKIKDYEKK